MSVTKIRIAKQDATLFDNWQGDLAEIDVDASLRAYDAWMIQRLQQAYPGADVDTDYQLSYQGGINFIAEVEGDDERGTGADEVRDHFMYIGEQLFEDPAPWLVEAGA